MTFEERQAMREGIARELGIQLYRQYSEPQAAHFLGKDVSTLKRWRKKKSHHSYIRQGADDDERAAIRYFGIHIADLHSGAAWDATQNDPLE